MLDIGTTLRRYRDKNAYSQQYVANSIGISRVAYRKWESNSVEFTINQLAKISELYHIPIDVIIRESHKNTNLCREFHC